MTILWKIPLLLSGLLATDSEPCRAVELTLGREAAPAAPNQLFGGRLLGAPDGKSFLMGNANSPCCGRRELKFLAPFLSHQVPSSMK